MISATLFEFQGPVPATTDIIIEQAKTNTELAPTVTENPFINEVTESTQSSSTPLSVYNWEVVDGWFAEYPLSIGMNRSFIFDQFSF